MNFSKLIIVDKMSILKQYSIVYFHSNLPKFNAQINNGSAQNKQYFMNTLVKSSVYSEYHFLHHDWLQCITWPMICDRVTPADPCRAKINMVTGCWPVWHHGVLLVWSTTARLVSSTTRLSTRRSPTTWTGSTRPLAEIWALLLPSSTRDDISIVNCSWCVCDVKKTQ